MPLAALFKLVALAAVCAAVVWFALRLVVKDLCKAGLITSAIVVLFFTFDRAVATAQNLINSLRWYWVRSEAPVSPLWVLLAEAIFLFLCAYGIVAKLKSARLPTAFLNVFSILLVVFPLAQVILVKRRRSGIGPARRSHFRSPPSPRIVRVPTSTTSFLTVTRVRT